VGHFWHPFADMASIAANGELVLVRGDGVHVWDEAGRRYLDATAGLWFANVGFGRREIADAAAAQIAALPRTTRSAISRTVRPPSSRSA
jgi:adenosylmethionine-8-amino-7-oxononanoate aminotransferase